MIPEIILNPPGTVTDHQILRFVQRMSDRQRSLDRNEAESIARLLLDAQGRAGQDLLSFVDCTHDYLISKRVSEYRNEPHGCTEFAIDLHIAPQQRYEYPPLEMWLGPDDYRDIPYPQVTRDNTYVTRGWPHPPAPQQPPQQKPQPEPKPSPSQPKITYFRTFE